MVTGATVTATLCNPDDSVVTGYANMVMTDVANTPGSYSLTLGGDFNPVVGNYYLLITASLGADGLTLRQPVEVRQLF